jgi:integrase
MTTRRGHGDGGIRKTADGKRWEGTISLGYVNGKRKRKSVYGSTYKECRERLKETQRAIEKGQCVDRQLTVEAFLDGWIHDTMPGTIRPITLDAYDRAVRNWINPHIGQIQLTKLTPADVQAMLRALEDQGLSPRTRQIARAVLRRALNVAVKWEQLDRNVAAMVDPPKGVESRNDALTAEQAQAILDVAKGHRFEALVTLALVLGLRRGELLGLRWTDVDFDRKEITVSRTISWMAGTGFVVHEPKTRMSARTIPMVLGVEAALREQRRKQRETRMAIGAEWESHGWVFATHKGTLLMPRNVLREFQKLTVAAGLGKVRLHAARHTAATLMLKNGVPLEVVSAILGHSSIRVTADVYAEVGMDAKRRGLAVLDEQLLAG